MNRTSNTRYPAGVATACGLLLAALVIALGMAIGAFWDAHTVIPTPAGPVVVQVQQP